MNKNIKIVIADDHRVFASGMEAIFKTVKDMDIVDSVKNGKELLQHIPHVKPDLVLMDINMPELNGVEATKMIKRKYPQIKVVVLSMHNDPVYVREMLGLGADGYLLKESHKNEIIKGIREVMAGKKYKSTSIVLPPVQKKTSHFTKKEIEILKLLAEGFTYKEIADELSKAHETVKTQVKNMLTKAEARNAAALTAWATQQKII